MDKNLYPSDEGWIRMELFLVKPTPLSEERIKEVATHGKQAEYEFGPITQYGRKLKVTLRHQSRRPESGVAR